MGNSNNVSIDNIYRLDGRVPVAKAIPFGLQHVFAMFVSNVTPIILIAATAGIEGTEKALLIQAAMLAAGIGTVVQLYPLWRVGSRLPVVMGVSFTFLASLQFVAGTYGYNAMIGAVIVGGCFEGLLGLTYKYWKKLVPPIASACVVTTIGFSLFTVGVQSFGGGYVEDFGAPKYMITAGITLVTCLLVQIFAKGFWRQLNVLFGMMVGYVVAIAMGIVNFSSISATISEAGFVSLPRVLPYMPEFNINAIVAVGIVFLVSATETIGDTTALVNGALKRDITEKEVSGSLACDGFMSAVSGCLGCAPITSFSQNVGLIAMTKVCNRFTILMGALTMILAGLFPPIGAFFCTIPDPVLGGCTIMMFGNILVAGMEMIARCGFSQRNTIIAALSIVVGVGSTLVSGFYSAFPSIVGDVFASNCVAGTFVIAIILNLVLPKNMEEEDHGSAE